jgi:hypothetical protein
MRVVALAASSLETCFAVRFHPTACRFWRNYSPLRAPIPGCVEATRAAQPNTRAAGRSLGQIRWLVRMLMLR